VRRGRTAKAAQRGIQGGRSDGGAFGEKTLAELAMDFGVHPMITSNWNQKFVKRAGELFARGSKAPTVDDAQKVFDDLHRKIRQLQVERDFLAGQPAISRVLRGRR
jgi:hypothetical protein